MNWTSLNRKSLVEKHLQVGVLQFFKEYKCRFELVQIPMDPRVIPSLTRRSERKDERVIGRGDEWMRKGDENVELGKEGKQEDETSALANRLESCAGRVVAILPSFLRSGRYSAPCWSCVCIFVHPSLFFLHLLFPCNAKTLHFSLRSILSRIDLKRKNFMLSHCDRDRRNTVSSESSSSRVKPGTEQIKNRACVKEQKRKRIVLLCYLWTGFKFCFCFSNSFLFSHLKIDRLEKVKTRTRVGQIDRVQCWLDFFFPIFSSNVIIYFFFIYQEE